jgi:hypothetical protein
VCAVCHVQWLRLRCCCRRLHCGLHFRTHAAEQLFGAYLHSNDSRVAFLVLAALYWLYVCFACCLDCRSCCCCMHRTPRATNRGTTPRRRVVPSLACVRLHTQERHRSSDFRVGVAAVVNANPAVRRADGAQRGPLQRGVGVRSALLQPAAAAHGLDARQSHHDVAHCRGSFFNVRALAHAWQAHVRETLSRRRASLPPAV